MSFSGLCLTKKRATISLLFVFAVCQFGVAIYYYTTLSFRDGMKPQRNINDSESLILPLSHFRPIRIDEMKRLLLIMPTVPFIYKGSDQRLLHILGYIKNNTDLNVTLAYFRSLRVDTGVGKDDNEIIRPLLRSYRLESVLGPLGPDGFSGSNMSFDLVMFWNWHNVGFMRVVIDSVRQMQINRGQTRVIALVDDDSVSSRAAISHFRHLKQPELENAILSMRPADKVYPVVQSKHNNRNLKHMVETELTTYQEMDLVVSISNNSLRFLKRFVNGQSFDVLRHSVPELSSTYKRDNSSAPPKLIFTGYSNSANNNGLRWFVEKVLPRIRTKGLVLHVAGRVNCRGGPKLKCEGMVENLDKLYATVSLAINPALETAGVATKTCAALQRGIPVITTSLDGTVGGLEPRGAEEKYGVVICPPHDVDCTVSAVDRLLASPELLARAGAAAVRFIERFYSQKNMFADIERIFRRARDRRLRLLVVGDHALTHGLFLQLVKHPRLSARLAPNVTCLSNLPTGTNLHFVVQLGWPLLLRTPPSRVCAANCRLVLWLPWRVEEALRSWKPLLPRFDAVWTADRKAANQVILSGIERSAVSVIPHKKACNIIPVVAPLNVCSIVTAEDAQRLGPRQDCWSYMAALSVQSLFQLLDDPHRRIGRREQWMSSHHHRLIGPTVVRCEGHCVVLTSKNGKWALKMTGGAKLTVSDVQSRTARWTSTPRNETDASRGSLHLGLDCRLEMRDGRGRVVWTTNKSVVEKRRFQCYVYLEENGILAVKWWVADKDFFLWKSQ